MPAEAGPDSGRPAANDPAANDPAPNDTAQPVAEPAEADTVTPESVESGPEPDAPAAPAGPAAVVPDDTAVSDTAVADAAVPLTRRERRATEVAAGPPDTPHPARRAGARPAAPSDAVSGALSDALPDENGRPVPRRPWAVARNAALFAVIAALVIVMGTVVADNRSADGPSATELARQHMLAATSGLLASATALQATADAAAQGPLNGTITNLAGQVTALSVGTAPPSNTAPPSKTVAPSTTAEALVTRLAANGTAALTAARVADGAMGRLFASVGTNQVVNARSLAAAFRLPAPTSHSLAPAAATPDPAPTCTGTRQPAPGMGEDRALAAAAAAEQKAVYAYQVATTRFAEPNFTQASTMLAVHEASLAELATQLAQRCLPAPATVPGFALAPGFTQNPASALAMLEEQVAGVYADLAAVSTPVADQATGSPMSLPGGPSPSPSPATTPSAGRSTAAATPAPAVDGLRLVAVEGLMQSTLNQVAWGGTVSALPGIPAATVPTTVPATAAP